MKYNIHVSLCFSGSFDYWDILNGWTSNGVHWIKTDPSIAIDKACLWILCYWPFLKNWKNWQRHLSHAFQFFPPKNWRHDNPRHAMSSPHHNIPSIPRSQSRVWTNWWDRNRRWRAYAKLRQETHRKVIGWLRVRVAFKEDAAAMDRRPPARPFLRSGFGIFHYFVGPFQAAAAAWQPDRERLEGVGEQLAGNKFGGKQDSWCFSSNQDERRHALLRMEMWVRVWRLQHRTKLIVFIHVESRSCETRTTPK